MVFYICILRKGFLIGSIWKSLTVKHSAIEFYFKALRVPSTIVLLLALSIQTHLFERGQQLQADITHLVPLDMFQQEGICLKILIREVVLKLGSYFAAQFT